MKAFWNFNLTLCESLVDSSHAFGDLLTNPSTIEAEQNVIGRPAPILFRRRVQKTNSVRSGSHGDLQGTSEKVLPSSTVQLGPKSSSSRAAYNRLVGVELAAESNLPSVENSEYEKDLHLAFMMLAENSLVDCDTVG